MKRKLIPTLSVAMFAIALAVMFFSGGGSADAQVSSDLDSTRPIFTERRFDSGVLQFTDEVGVWVSNPATVWVTRSDGNGNPIISRAANADEIAFYNEYLAELQVEEAQNNLTGTQEGSQWGSWIDNQSTALQTCQNDAIAGQALGDWTTMSAGQQNAVIQSLLNCQELESRVTRITINRLYDLLVREGIIEP